MSAAAALARVGVRARGARHKALVRLFSGVMPYYVVNEFPKSGGTWLSQMLADAMGVPFRQNRPLRLERSIAHGHFLEPRGLHNVVVLWRDPRDLMVSFYYHCYFLNEHHNGLLVRLMKQRLPFDDYHDVAANLPAFIRLMATRPVTPPFTWSQFARVWAGREGVVETSYEALRRDTAGSLAGIVRALSGAELPKEEAEAIARRHSFENARRRAAAAATDEVEISFVREGNVGGWRRHFGPEAEHVFAQHFGDLASRLGYA